MGKDRVHKKPSRHSGREQLQAAIAIMAAQTSLQHAIPGNTSTPPPLDTPTASHLDEPQQIAPPPGSPAGRPEMTCPPGIGHAPEPKITGTIHTSDAACDNPFWQRYLETSVPRYIHEHNNNNNLSG